MIVDDRDPQRLHGSAAGSWTWTCVPRGVLGRNRTAPPSSAARSRIAVSPTPSDHLTTDADTVVDHVDLDGRTR